MDNASLHDVLSCCCRCVPVMRSFMKITARGGFKSREHQQRSIQVFRSRGGWGCGSPEFVWLGVVAAFRGAHVPRPENGFEAASGRLLCMACVVSDRVDGRF